MCIYIYAHMKIMLEKKTKNQMNNEMEMGLA